MSSVTVVPADDVPVVSASESADASGMKITTADLAGMGMTFVAGAALGTWYLTSGSAVPVADPATVSTYELPALISPQLTTPRIVPPAIPMKQVRYCDWVDGYAIVEDFDGTLWLIVGDSLPPLDFNRWFDVPTNQLRTPPEHYERPSKPTELQYLLLNAGQKDEASDHRRPGDDPACDVGTDDWRQKHCP